MELHSFSSPFLCFEQFPSIAYHFGPSDTVLLLASDSPGAMASIRLCKCGLVKSLSKHTVALNLLLEHLATMKAAASNKSQTTQLHFFYFKRTRGFSTLRVQYQAALATDTKESVEIQTMAINK